MESVFKTIFIMGCHTWFFNKISAITAEEIEKFKKRAANEIKNYSISKKTCDEYLKDIESNIKNAENTGNKEWALLLKKIGTREHYEKVTKDNKKALKLFESDCTDINKLRKPFSEHFSLFGKGFGEYYNVAAYNDKFRVYGYPKEKFYDADSAIKFLEDYDDSLISYEGNNGMCNEIKDIIREFFKKYPQGRLEFG